MKGEHWKTLEDIVGTELNVEELTLSILDKINIFSYGTEIQEVAQIFFYLIIYLCIMFFFSLSCKAMSSVINYFNFLTFRCLDRLLGRLQSRPSLQRFVNGTI